MRTIPAMVDMAYTEQEKQEAADSGCALSPEFQPKYPYGLCISMDEQSMDKIGLDLDGVNIGDMLHLHCLARLTSMSMNESDSGRKGRIELQITHISAEDEDDENEEEEAKPRKQLSSLYRQE
jgi:hypothetical protein